jgi:hypothetical protein
MKLPPNQAGRVGKSLVSAGRGVIFGSGQTGFSKILTERAEAGRRIDEYV